ncbi:DUF881 domain-containing protein [Nocardioides ungokensis]|uniref:DUF881 domain-containing protein n=1 Tax=Nocardioides ungokensis TaxID=1643322 RepID=UPI0015DF7856|nr:DUF881 domain-containing protein [Nocardioides ungokensis]
MPEHVSRGDVHLPARVTMPLLTLITQQSLDEDYLHVAERRAAGAPRPSRARPHRMAAVVVAVFGILVTTAAVQTSRNAGVTDAGRATLISQIDTRRATVDKLQQEMVTLREHNVGLESQLSDVTSAEEAAATRVRNLETTTGFGPVTGEGVRIVVSDAPNGDATQAVRDEDLAKLVDGLWVAGAEAISINGQRLTVLSAIRNVNVAIHVNSRPLTPPYTVSAIGDNRTLQANLLSSTLGSEFFSLAQQLGFVYSMQNEDSLTLPAARFPRLREAQTGTAAEQQHHPNEESNP